MPRNRIIYQSEALYAGPSPATGFHLTSGANIPWVGPTGNSLVNQLQRIQTANYSFTVDRTDVNQFGQLAAIDRVILTNPTVSLDFSYILANLSNESDLGFTLNKSGDTTEVSAISGFLNGTSDERNYFIRTVPEGNDAVSYNDSGIANNGVIGIGNGFISSYSSEGSVGNLPTVTVNVEGLNMTFQKGVTGNYIPAVNPVDGVSVSNFYSLQTATQNNSTGVNSGISALRPGDITVSIPSISGAGGGVDTSVMNIQSYTLSFDLARTPIQKLGNRFAFSRPIDFPLAVTLKVEAQATDMTTGSLNALLCSDTATFDPSITIKSPICGNNDVVAKYTLKGAKLDSQEFSSDIGSNKSVTLTFSAQVGGPQDKDRGLFISGFHPILG
jgi:hypothetical protein